MVSVSPAHHGRVRRACPSAQDAGRPPVPLLALAELTQLLLAEMLVEQVFAEIAFLAPRALGPGVVSGITVEQDGTQDLLRSPSATC